MTTPDNRARHVLDNYLRTAANPQTITDHDLLRKLIASAINKAMIEDRDALREKLPCDGENPCAFENVCSHHKALAAALLGEAPLTS